MLAGIDSPDSIARVPTEGPYLDEEGRYWPLPFGASPTVGVGPAVILTSPGNRFMVDRHARDGRHLLRLRVDQEPRAISEADVEAYRQARLDEAESEAALQRRFQELPFPDRYPVVDRLLIDAVGALWVGMYDPDSAAPKTWHVFAESGEHLAHVTTPAGLVVQYIQEDAVLGRWRDSLGVPSVRVHRLDRSEPD